MGVLLPAGVAVAGESAAVPELGPHRWYPPWDLALGPGSALVTVLLLVAVAAGAGAVGLGLLAVRRGAVLGPRTIAAAGVAAVAVLCVVPPLGSADHLSYAAYGRIAAAGDDPYREDPSAWRDGTDPVASAVQPPWQHTRSVYGPVATAAQAVVAELGGGSLRLTVWLWQVLAAGAFLATALALDRLTRGDPAARTRAALLWTLNPLLLVQLVLGGHVDGLAVAGTVGALALIARRPALAGVLFGLAVGSKITYALFGLALLWGLRRLPPRELAGRLGLAALGAGAVLVPAHLWSGPHTYDQLHQASRMVSLATPWRPLVDQLDPVFGGVVRTVVGPASLVLAVALGVVLARRLLVRSTTGGPDVADGAAVAGSGVAVGRPGGADVDPRLATMDAARAAVVVGAAWVLTVPYALPWYDAMVWAPLALLAAAPGLEAALLVRLAVLAAAYVPGRVVGLSPAIEDLTLGLRRGVAPWLLLAVLVAVTAWALDRPRRRRPGPAPVDR